MDSTVTATKALEFPSDLSTARPGLDAMAGSDVGPIQPSLGKRASRGLVRFVFVFSIGVGATLAWQCYGDAARARIATSWPQLASLAPDVVPVPQGASEPITAAPQAIASPELQELKQNLAQLKEELQQLKEVSPALANLRQSVDQLAGSQQQIAGTINKLGTRQQELLHKLASVPPRAAPAPTPKPVPQPQRELRGSVPNALD
jgi:hypothetical protein